MFQIMKKIDLMYESYYNGEILKEELQNRISSILAMIASGAIQL